MRIVKRPGELGVHSMDSFRLAVPDLTVAEGFYKAFGLDVREEGGGLGLYTFGSEHRWASLREGGRKKLGSLSFGVFEEDFEPMKRRVEAEGIQLLDAPPGVDTDGVWFYDHNGLLIEMKVADKTSPNEKMSFSMPSAPAGVAAAPQRSRAVPVQPRRLAHILVFTADLPKAIGFYSRVLGLRLSDRSGDDVCFMHGIHGSDHHLIAFARSSAPGLHHCSWDVGSINEIGAGAMRMAERGFQKGWGLGRHVLGSNYFHYVQDPWGSYSEYSSDIDYIPSDCDWASGDYPGEDAIYLWGPNIPDGFIFNHELSGA
ncbi:VOC family protein [Xanthobacter autotrophicus DSM 431]|uniref:VOC family protein n=1 Tax=Xanthobacter nonsaccharivorans TaxID=3119912 RepID=UPI003726E230